MDDAELLHRYVSEGSEAAFRELVNRHLNVIHAAVLRQVGGDTHLAQDVVQRVFVSLARKARILSGKTILVGWLYTAARLEAARAVRTEIRQRHRKEKAQAMNSTDSNDRAETIPWEELSPMLDEAMAALGDADREAVLLRYFSGKSFVEIGRACTLSDEAARKRVDRAIEKLRHILRQRGLASSAAALGLTISAHAAVAPSQAVIDLLAASSWSGLASSAALQTGIFMGLNKLTMGAAGAALVLALGVLVKDGVTRQNHAREFDSTQQKLHEANQRYRDGERELASLRRDVTDRTAQRMAVAPTRVPTPGAPTDFRTDPEYQRLALASSFGRRHQDFQRLYRRLGLNAAQMTEFENIMALQDQANLEAAAIKTQGGDPQTVFKQSGPDWSSAMRNLVGEAGFAQLEDYLKTMPVRAFVDSLAGPTTDLGVPLSLDQSDRLAQAALAHDAAYRSGKGTDPGTVNWDEVWPEATRILSTEQLEIFRATVAMWQQQKQVQRMLAAQINQ